MQATLMGRCVASKRTCSSPEALWANAFPMATYEFASYPGLLKAAARGDIGTVSSIINGGSNGDKDRKMWFSRWERQLRDRQ